MKKLILLLLLSLLTLPSIANAADSTSEVGEQFRITNPDVWSAGVLIDDSADLKRQWVGLQAFTGLKSNDSGQFTKIHNCSTFGAPECEPDKYFAYQALLPFCSTDSTANCVSDLTATGADGKSYQAKFVEEFPGKTKYSFEGNTDADLPNSGSSFIVSIPDLPHAHGDNYLVVVQLIGNKLGTDSRFRINQFRAGIFAVTVEDGKFKVPFSSDELSHYPNAFLGARAADNSGWDYGINAMPKCAQMSETRCALAWPLPLDVNFEMTLRMKIAINGWLHGRLQDAKASISTSNNGLQIIKIGGKPVVVPIVYKSIPRSELPTSVTDFYQTTADKLNLNFNFGNSSGQVSTYRNLSEYTAQEFPEAIMWYKALSDTAPYSSTAWSFRNIQNGQLGSGCATSSIGLTGLVSTNSNMYVAQPPTFNQANQTLDYQVTSPHFLPDGSVFKGTYNLVIDSEFARCIYGFSKAPVSATISILSSDGTEQIATTLLSEKDGWIRLSASNFTFSAPLIRVKLSQKGKKLTSILCQKGSSTKKISGYAPRCPTGYKKVG